MDDEKNSPDLHEARSWTYMRGRDIWIRARTNAFAHKIAAKRMSFWANTMFILQTIFTIIPIICVGISLTLITEGPQSSIAALPTYRLLAIISIISNGIALLINMLMIWCQWKEHSLQHQHMMSNFALIAQKARRLDGANISVEEAAHLCRHLEESFEIFKMSGMEASEKCFKKAQYLMTTLIAYPFGLTAKDLDPSIKPV